MISLIKLVTGETIIGEGSPQCMRNPYIISYVTGETADAVTLAPYCIFAPSEETVCIEPSSIVSRLSRVRTSVEELYRHTVRAQAESDKSFDEVFDMINSTLVDNTTTNEEETSETHETKFH